jgi:hypothetical protein
VQLIDKYGPLTVQQIRNSPFDGQVAYLRKKDHPLYRWGSGDLATLTVEDVAAWRPLAHASPPSFLVVNYEDAAANWMAGGYAVGVDRGVWIRDRLAELGIANDPFVYISADFHPGGALPAVLDCLRGVQSVLGAQGRALYGFVETLDAARAAGLIDHAWLCGDRAGLTGRPWVALYQHNNDQSSVGGVTVDVNDVLLPDFGQWLPDGGDDVSYTQWPQADREQLLREIGDIAVPRAIAAIVAAVWGAPINDLSADGIAAKRAIPAAVWLGFSDARAQLVQGAAVTATQALAPALTQAVADGAGALHAAVHDAVTTAMAAQPAAAQAAVDTHALATAVVGQFATKLGA